MLSYHSFFVIAFRMWSDHVPMSIVRNSNDQANHIEMINEACKFMTNEILFLWISEKIIIEISEHQRWSWFEQMIGAPVNLTQHNILGLIWGRNLRLTCNEIQTFFLNLLSEWLTKLNNLVLLQKIILYMFRYPIRLQFIFVFLFILLNSFVVL